jgi:hypothetical protein
LNFSIWAIEDFQKKSIFISYLILTNFCHYLCLPLDRFLFEFFWLRNFWGSCYSSLCFNGCYTWVETEPKSRFTIMLTLMLLIRIVWSFVWRKFSSVEKGEWWDEIKYGQKLNLGDSHVTLRNIQEVQASKLGMPRGTPSSSAKIRSPFKTLYFYCFVLYAFFLERLYFLFQFYFVLFATLNGWTPTYFFWRRCTLFFIAKNTLVFTLFVQWVFSFSSTAFSFRFSPWFLFRTCYFFVSRCV